MEQVDMRGGPKKAFAERDEVCNVEDAHGIKVMKIAAEEEEEPSHERVYGEVEPSTGEIEAEHAFARLQRQKALHRQRKAIGQIRRERPLFLQLLGLSL